MIIAQISDLHVMRPGEKVFGIVNTNAMVAAAIAKLSRLIPAPDVVVATGDLVNEGTVEEYELLRSLLAPLTMPVLLAVGNHDNRDTLRQVFPDHAYLPQGPYLHYVIDDYPVRLIVMDTQIPGKTGGAVDASRLAWLEAQLTAAPQRPTLLFLHHPPFPVGVEALDRMGCEGGEALADLVRQFPQVERVACGHFHRPIQTRWAGTVASIAPSVVHQIILSLGEGAPSHGIVMEPPGFYLHTWHDGVGLTTHTAYVDAFPAYCYKTGEAMGYV